MYQRLKVRVAESAEFPEFVEFAELVVPTGAHGGPKSFHLGTRPHPEKSRPTSTRDCMRDTNNPIGNCIGLRQLAFSFGIEG